jgi:hypothetical protein
MGDEDKDWEIWLDEYTTQTVANITIDMDDYINSGAAGVVDHDWIDYQDWAIRDFNTNNDITLTGGGEEMLRVAEDGFYIRGVRVEADDKEAKHVYEAFKQWLVWNTLTNQNN